jgi:bacterioferritin
MASRVPAVATNPITHLGASVRIHCEVFMASFIKDIEEIRERARQKIDDGAVTENYELDKEQVVSILNDALATEIVCVLRYMHHYFMATGVHGRAVADEFKEHADDEREHADELAERIQQLGGAPDFNPASLLQRSVAQYVEGETLADMIREDLIAERTVIEVYQRMIKFFGEKDPTTRRLIEHIKEEEEEHASDLSDFLYIVDPKTGETEGQDPGTNPLNRGQNSGQSQSRQPQTDRSDASAQRAQHQAAMRRPGDTVRRGADFAGSEETGEAPAGMSSLPGQSGKTRSLNVSPTPQNQGGETQPSGGKRQNREEVDQDERWGNLGHSQVEGRARDTRRQEQAQSGIKGEARPARDRGTAKRGEREPFAGRGSVQAPASNLPGVGGRTMNRRRTSDEVDESEVARRGNAGASSGTNRSPKVTNKNRKNKRAA